MSTPTPIHRLDPSTSPPASQSIRGVVTLVWPYSSSTRQCAFLVSDPDFRLRSKKGQVRVRFTGASAKAVAERHVGIGDEILLGLEGAKWGEDSERNKTPGRSVEGELVFGRKVGLDVKRDGAGEEGWERVEINAPASPPPTSLHGREDVNGHTEVATPALRPANGLLRKGLGSSFADGGWTYSSPAFAKRVRLSSGEGVGLDGAFDPFLDGELSPTKESKRTSFGTGLRWRFQSRTPSPVKDGFGAEEVEVESPVRDGRGKRAEPDGLETEEAEAEADLMAQKDGLEGEDTESQVEATVEAGEVAVEVSSPSGAIHLPQATSSASLSPTPSPSRAARGAASSPGEPTQETPPTMLPQTLPRLSMPDDEPPEPQKPRQPTQGPSTPKLGPVKSPTLPLPSPFPADAPQPLPTRPPAYSANSLFGALGSAASVIESRRLSGRHSQASLRPPQPASLPPPVQPVFAPTPAGAQTTPVTTAPKPRLSPRKPEAEVIDLTDDEDEDEEILDDNGPTQESEVNASFSTTIADDEMYEDYERSDFEVDAGGDDVMLQEERAATEKITSSLIADSGDMEEDESIVEVQAGEPDVIGTAEREDEIALADSAMLSGGLERSQRQPPDGLSLDGAAPLLPQPESSSTMRPAPSSSEELRTADVATPSMPAKKPPSSAFGFDGASAHHITPEAERARVKKNTYRSLFGLRSPTKDQTPAVEAPVKERQEERFIPGWFFEIDRQPRQPDGQTYDIVNGGEERQEVGGRKSSTVDEDDAMIVDGAPIDQEESLVAEDNVDMIEGRDAMVDDNPLLDEEHSIASEEGPKVQNEGVMAEDEGFMADKSPVTHDQIATNAATAPDGLHQQLAASEDTDKQSRLEVTELDVSSDVEEEDDAGPTAKPSAQELAAPSAVIQDSLEESADEIIAVSEDETQTRRPSARRLKEDVLVETAPPSSLLAEPGLQPLPADVNNASEAPRQERIDLVKGVDEPSSPPQDVDMMSSPTPKTTHAAAEEEEVNEHIAPPRRIAASTVVELGPYTQSTKKQPTSPVRRSPRKAAARRSEVSSSAPADTAPRTSKEAPQQSQIEGSLSPPPVSRYPNLPLSPSNSQSLQDSQSQRRVEEFPRSGLPPTPQLTQRGSSARSEERSSQKTPAHKLLRNGSSLRAEAKEAESPITPQTKTPSRRSARLRVSNVPDVLSEWFSPRSSGVAPDASKIQQKSGEKPSPSLEDTDVADAALANDLSSSNNAGLAQLHTSGFATAHSYFTPLSRLSELLNPSSQHSHGTSSIDTFAVITDKPTEPSRAKAGPKDYYTIFRITDPSIPTTESLRVEVFRPYKNTLPLADVGDVVLLRAFTVKSKKRTPYLLSRDESAWCVWQYPDVREQGKPVWARKTIRDGGVKEEMRGPPVEFGEEERGRAARLREWWVASRDEKAGEAVERRTVNGKVAEEVAAKL